MSTSAIPTPNAYVRWLRILGQQLFLPLLGIVTALIVGAIIILISGFDPLAAYGGLLNGAFGNLERVNNTLAAATPYVFTTLAVVLAFRAGLFNVGAEGQFKIGALAAAWVGINLGDLPAFIAIPATLAAGLLGGMMWGAIPGVLKAYFGSHEVIITIMLNYIATFITSYLVGADGPLRGTQMTRTAQIGENARIPTLFNNDAGQTSSNLPLHVGFIIAIMMAGFLYWLLWRTPLGFEIRTVGLNPSAARYAGINVRAIMIIAMAGGGLLAGMAGALEVMGNPSVRYQYSASLGVSYGFNSIAIALLAKNSPLVALPASLLFACLQTGASQMQYDTQIPGDLISIIQALVIIFVAADQIIRWLYRLPKAANDQVTLSSSWGEDAKKIARKLNPSQLIITLRGLARFGWPMIAVGTLITIFAWRTFTGTQPLIDTVSIIILTLSFATPITLGALSGTFSERSGVVNIGIEGMMLTGAFFAALVSILTGNVWLGLLTVPFSGMAMALMHAVLCIYFKVDQIISGTVINIFAFGLTSYLLSLILTNREPSNQAESLFAIDFKINANPFAICFGKEACKAADGATLSAAPFTLGLISILAVVLVFVSHYILFYTTWGLRTRAVGENPKAADTAGINVYKIRYFNVLASGVLAALGGTYFSLQVVGYFREGMTVGSGFIALAAMIFGKWTPLGAWGAALLFGFCQGLDTALQSWYGQSSEWLHTITQALPYLVTIIVLTGVIGRSRPPAAVGQPYNKQ